MARDGDAEAPAEALDETRGVSVDRRRFLEQRHDSVSPADAAVADAELGDSKVPAARVAGVNDAAVLDLDPRPQLVHLADRPRLRKRGGVPDSVRRRVVVARPADRERELADAADGI